MIEAFAVDSSIAEVDEEDLEELGTESNVVIAALPSEYAHQSVGKLQRESVIHSVPS